MSETDEEGSYFLRYQGAPGTAPGSYKVGVSLYTTPEGRVMSLGARDALTTPPGFEQAFERLPVRYSDFGQTDLTVEVTDRGGTFDFDLEGPLLDPPTAEESGESAEEPEAGAAEESAGPESSDGEPAAEEAPADAP
ncbi:carboxypeptidase regulatory-like domain-containing protein [Tautonia sp. JC769]|uniref:carboxypeptidase regulatory-like domain-containing protein n=1 Tax=Tautonia sp. JC769 TaxID=3232135 RepID=UPI00345A7F33